MRWMSVLVPTGTIDVASKDNMPSIALNAETHGFSVHGRIMFKVVSRWSVMRHQLATHKDGGAPAHPPQICATPPMGLPCAQGMVHLTVPKTLPRHQGRHQVGRRAALRHIQIQTPFLDNPYCRTTGKGDQSYDIFSDRHPGMRRRAT